MDAALRRQTKVSASHREHPLTRRLAEPRRAAAFVVNDAIMEPRRRESNNFTTSEIAAAATGKTGSFPG
jgi:hypothetical protein